MPIYVYDCAKCDRPFDEYRAIKDRDRHATCPECGGMCDRDRFGEHQAPVRLDYRTPIELYSIAPATQAEYNDMRRRNPGLKFNDQLVPVVHNRQEKLRLFKREGVQER